MQKLLLTDSRLSVFDVVPKIDPTVVFCPVRSAAVCSKRRLKGKNLRRSRAAARLGHGLMSY